MQQKGSSESRDRSLASKVAAVARLIGALGVSVALGLAILRLDSMSAAMSHIRANAAILAAFTRHQIELEIKVMEELEDFIDMEAQRVSTLKKTLADGTVFEFPCPREPGETVTAWMTRCKAEFKEACKVLEGTDG